MTVELNEGGEAQAEDRMTKAQHFDDIISQVAGLYDKYKAAKTVGDILLLIEDTKLQLNCISLQLQIFKHFNNID